MVKLYIVFINPNLSLPRKLIYGTGLGLVSILAPDSLAQEAKVENLKPNQIKLTEASAAKAPLLTVDLASPKYEFTRENLDRYGVIDKTNPEDLKFSFDTDTIQALKSEAKEEAKSTATISEEELFNSYLVQKIVAKAMERRFSSIENLENPTSKRKHQLLASMSFIQFLYREKGENQEMLEPEPKLIKEFIGDVLASGDNPKYLKFVLESTDTEKHEILRYVARIINDKMQDNSLDDRGRIITGKAMQHVSQVFSGYTSLNDTFARSSRGELEPGEKVLQGVFNR